MICEHLKAAGTPEPQSTEGCQDCIAQDTQWVHLRLCLECGKVSCCDSSPWKHATAHYHDSGHPVIRSFEQGEYWRWCYLDEVIG